MRAELPDKKELRSGLVILGVFVLLAGAVWYGSYRQRAGYEARIATARKQLGIDLAPAQGLSELNSRVARMRARVSGAQRHVPQQDRITDVFRSMDQAMRRHGVRDPQIIAEEARAYANYSLVPLTIELQCGFRSLYGVLSEIESMPRLMRIDRLSIDRPRHRSAEDPAEALNVELEMSVFFSRVDTEEPS